MERRCAFCLSLVMGIGPLLAQETSPDAGSFEVEPPLLVQPDGTPVAPPETSPQPERDLAQLEKRLERAKRSAASAERLFKAGILAKAEAEERALRVIRLQAELAKAQLTQIQEQIGKAPGDGIVQVQSAVRDDLKALLAQASAAEKEAAANLEKAELDAAILNLQRQQKLRALGSARKADVARAEEKLAALKRGQAQ
jgi:hypothetical protein